MSWLDDVLAQLQGGAAPAAYMPPPSAFPDIPRPATPEEEAAAAQAARDAAGERMVRANRRRVDPFAVPDASAPGVQFAIGGTPQGVPAPLGAPPIGPAGLAMMPNASGALRAGPPDGSIFGGVPDMAQFNPVTVSPSVQAATAMAKPPAPPPAQGPVPGIVPPGSVPGMPAGPGGDTARANPQDEGPAGGVPARPSTDVSAQRRPRVQEAIPPELLAPPKKGFLDSLAEIGQGLSAMGAIATGEGTGPSERLAARRAADQKELATQNMTANWLLARGAPAAEVAAAVRSPEVLKAMITKYGEAKNAQVVNGRLVRERPDGTVELLADYSDDKEKAPTQREVKLPDGSVQQQEWIKGRGWQDVGKPAPTERAHRLSVSDITKMSEEGQKADQVKGFISTFQPDFGGWKSQSVGDIVNTAARNLPESVVGKKAAAAAGWWQDYDRYKNIVRHGLYGASLTANETKAFMQADIHPGMEPAQIQRNLAEQQRLVDNSIRRKGKGLIGSAYPKEAVAQAYGVDPAFFDQPDVPYSAGGRSGSVNVNGVKLDWSLK